MVSVSALVLFLFVGQAGATAASDEGANARGDKMTGSLEFIDSLHTGATPAQVKFAVAGAVAEAYDIPEEDIDIEATQAVRKGEDLPEDQQTAESEDFWSVKYEAVIPDAKKAAATAAAQAIHGDTAHFSATLSDKFKTVEIFLDTEFAVDSFTPIKAGTIHGGEWEGEHTYEKEEEAEIVESDKEIDAEEKEEEKELTPEDIARKTMRIYYLLGATLFTGVFFMIMHVHGCGMNKKPTKVAAAGP